MKKLSVFLCAALAAGVALAFESYYAPGFVQAKFTKACGGNVPPNFEKYTNLFWTVDNDNVDETLGTLMADSFFSSDAVSVQNPLSGRRWNYNSSSTAFAYEGQMYMVAGVTYNFWGQVDDGAAIIVDDTEIVNSGTSSMSQYSKGGLTGSITPSTTGWHDVRVILWDWGTGKGPASACFGIAWNTNGVTKTGGTISTSNASWSFLRDPGDCSLVRHLIDFDFINVRSDPAGYGSPTPQFGRKRVALGDVLHLSAPADTVSNTTARIEYYCTGWRMTTPAGVTTSGADLSLDLSIAADNVGSTFTWVFSPRELQLQDVYVVPSGTSGVTPVAPYSSWATAATSLADAVAVGPNICINVAPGVYAITETISLNKKTQTIRSNDNGAFNRAAVILDGGAPERTNRLFSVTADGIVLKGLTVRNVLFGGDGAAINVGSGGTSFSAADCTFENCRTLETGNYKGGAIYSSVTTGFFVTNCLFTGCAAFYGGGVAFPNNLFSGWRARENCPIVSGSQFMTNSICGTGNQGDGPGTYGSLWVENSLFNGNLVRDSSKRDFASAATGGKYAVFTNCVFECHTNGYRGVVGGTDGASAQALVVDSVIRNNNGVYSLFTSNAKVERCVITNNTMNMSSGSTSLSERGLSGFTIRNSLFAYNDGAFSIANSTAENCTIVSNRWGIFLPSSVNTPTVRNCVSYGNYGQPISGYYYGTADFSYERGAGWLRSTTAPLKFSNVVVLNAYGLRTYNKGTFDFIELDPSGATSNIVKQAEAKGIRFVNPENGDWRLKHSSPLRDVGLTLDWMTEEATDLDGNSRIFGPAPDIGAYEISFNPGLMLIIK